MRSGHIKAERNRLVCGRSTANTFSSRTDGKTDATGAAAQLVGRTHRQTDATIGAYLAHWIAESHSAALECFTSSAWQTAIGGAAAAASGQISSLALPLFGSQSFSQSAFELVQDLAKHSNFHQANMGRPAHGAY